MSKWTIAWRSIQRRGLASSLTTLSMALGVMLVVAVVSIHGVVEQSFRNNSGLGYNMIVGAKGGQLQLVLNTVFYLSQPVENILYEHYLEFLSASDIEQYRRAVGMDELGEPRDGKYAKFTSFAIPVCLGDYFGHFRVVGTTPQLFENFVYDAVEGKKYEFERGRNFVTNGEEYGYFECVVGAKVARDRELEIGSEIAATHGDPEGELHNDHPFTVVGILKVSGTPNDRAVFVNIEGFYLMDGHAKPIEKPSVEKGVESDALATSEEISDKEAIPASEADAHGNHREHVETPTSAPQFRPLSIPEREVTAILIKTINQVVQPGLTNIINEAPVAQAASPVAEIFALFNVIVRPIKQTLLVLTIVICIVSGVSILVSIYNSMSDRRHEIAVMRALGAGRSTVMMVVLFESIMLSLGGGLLGWLVGHGLIGLASPTIEDRTGVTIGFFDFPSVNINENPYVNVDWLLTAINGLREGLGFDPISSLPLPTELWLIPGLVLLAIVVGLLPALAAYRTDVAKALTSSP